MILKASFDPITNKEIEIIKNYLKVDKDVFLYVKDEGVIDRKIRIKLLKKAIKPYRHIKITDTSKEAIQLEEIDEEEVRNGNYELAAWGIKKILISEGYYYPYLAKKMCSDYRYTHSMSVAETARKLAKHYALDEKYAYNIGLLHDITKDISLEESKELLKERKEVLELSNKVWHSFSAPIWLNNNLGIKDKRFLNAIERHTLGNTKTKYDEVIYIADKIEPQRKYDITKETKLAYEDLSKAAEFIRKEVKEILEKEK